MLLFLRPNLARSRFFHGLSVAGALSVCAVVLAMAPVTAVQVAGWIALILLAEAGTSAVNERMAAAPPAPARLRRWAGIKTATSAAQGLAWSLGVGLLHVPGEPVTVLAPAWAILTVTVGIIYACAAWPPALQAMATAANLPAVLMLLALGGTVEVAVAVCMGVSLVFALTIGTLAVRNVGDLIRARLDLSDLLARQTALTDRLAALNADRTRFFSAASHDLRQPLQALGFYTTLLADTAAGAPPDDVLPRLTACVEALDRQFNAILGVAATDAAIARAEPVALDLDALLARVVEAQRPDAQVRGLRLRQRRSGAVVAAPPDVLERVVQNLLSNALRYTRQGGVLVTARRRGNRVEVLVADTGIGIAAPDLARVFDDFVQLSNPERNTLAGFGLGLAIVKRLCDGFGWPVAVRSVPGRGSVFRVSLPTASRPLPDEPQGAPPEPVLPPVSVVILDDDGAVRDATARLMQRWGLRHLLLSDSTDLEARVAAFLAPGGPACALVDYRLRDGDTGIAVADRLRAAFGDRLGLILLTGETAPEVRTTAQSRGMVVLGKPLKPIRLRAAIAAACPADPGGPG